MVLKLGWCRNKKVCGTMEPPTTDSPYYGNLHNMDKSFCGPESFPTVYCNLRIVETSPLWITDTVATPQRTKSILWKWTVLTYWCKRVEKCLLFLKILAVFIHSTMFQGLSVIKERSTFNHVAYGNWKWSSYYRVHSSYKGHLPIADTLVWSCRVRNSEVLLYCRLGVGNSQ